MASGGLRGATLAVFLAQLFGALFVFGGQVLAARVLGVSEFGIYIYLLTWVTVIGLFAKLGLDGSAVKVIRNSLARREDAGAIGVALYALGIGTLASAVAGALFAAAAVLFGSQIPLIALVLAAAFLPFASAAQIGSGVLRGYARPVASVLPIVTFRPLIILIGVSLIGTLLPQFANASGQFVLVLLATSAAAILTWIWIGREFRRGVSVELDRARIRDIHHVGFSMLGVIAAAYIMRQADILMLGNLVSPDQAGIYSTAVRIVDFIGYPLVAANMVIGPLIAGRHATGAVASLGQTVRRATRVVFVVTCLCGFLMLLLGETVLSLFGNEFRTAYVPLLILIAGQLANAATGPAIELMIMTEHHRAAAKVLWIYLTINIVLNGLLIPRFGMTGAAAATAISLAGWNISLALMAKRRVGISPFVGAGLHEEQ